MAHKDRALALKKCPNLTYLEAEYQKRLNYLIAAPRAKNIHSIRDISASDHERQKRLDSLSEISEAEDFCYDGYLTQREWQKFYAEHPAPPSVQYTFIPYQPTIYYSLKHPFGTLFPDFGN